LRCLYTRWVQTAVHYVPVPPPCSLLFTFWWSCGRPVSRPEWWRLVCY